MEEIRPEVMSHIFVTNFNYANLNLNSLILDSCYTPGIYADGYIVFAFPFVRSYVRSFVSSFLRS